MLKKMNEAMAL